MEDVQSEVYGTDLNTGLLEHGTAGSRMEGDTSGISLEL